MGYRYERAGRYRRGDIEGEGGRLEIYKGDNGYVDRGVEK